MTYWTKKRLTALLVHAALAALLLVWSLGSSLHFWTYAFTDAVYAYGAVICIDGIALLGFILHVARVQSPLAHARHVLPFASAVPLGYDMHKQFVHLGGVQTWAFTIGITALLVVLAFVVWRTIERLFISDVEAARAYAEEHMHALQVRSEQMHVMREAADAFVQKHLAFQADALQPVQLPAPVATVYARPAGPPEQPLLGADADAQACTMHPMQPMLDAHADVQASNADAMHDAVQQYACARCGAMHDAPGGKSPKALRQASGRYGCPACKTAK